MTFAAPFWLPAITPNRVPIVLKWVKWLAVAGALFVAWRALSSLLAYVNLENAAVEFPEFRRRMITVYASLSLASICGCGVFFRRGYSFGPSRAQRERNHPVLGSDPDKYLILKSNQTKHDRDRAFRRPFF